jgi:hypothetical protein
MRLNGNEQETIYLAVKDAGLRATEKILWGQAEVELSRNFKADMAIYGCIWL